VVIRAVRDRLAGSLGLRAKLQKLNTLALEQSLHDFQLGPECSHSFGKMEFGVIDFFCSNSRRSFMFGITPRQRSFVSPFSTAGLVAYNVPARLLPFQSLYFWFSYLSDREFLSLIRKLRGKDIKVAKTEDASNPL
jgi:hypothetical protein